MREIPLTRDKVAIVDDEDYERLKGLKWYAHCARGLWYAVCSNGKKPIHMHHVVLRLSGDQRVDHRDCDGLNNRKENLRLATHAQNMRNRRRQSNNTSGFKGVYLSKRGDRWLGQIKFNGQYTYLGSFLQAADAARAYDAKARELYGDFARLNFSDRVLSVDEIEHLRVRRGKHHNKGKK